MKSNHQITQDERIYLGLHIVVSFLLSLITLKIIFLILDEFQIGTDWLNQSSIMGRLLMMILFLFLFLIYDILMSSQTNINGIISIFIKSMNNDFDPEIYINDDQQSIFNESNIISPDFIKEFDSNTFGNHCLPLEGINIPQESDVGEEQIDKIVEEFEPKTVKDPEPNISDKNELKEMIRACMLELMEEDVNSFESIE